MSKYNPVRMNIFAKNYLRDQQKIASPSSLFAKSWIGIDLPDNKDSLPLIVLLSNGDGRPTSPEETKWQQALRVDVYGNPVTYSLGETDSLAWEVFRELANIIDLHGVIERVTRSTPVEERDSSLNRPAFSFNTVHIMAAIRENN